MQTSKTGIAIAMFMALMATTGMTASEAQARPKEQKWIMKCCGTCALINTMPNPSTKDTGKCEHFREREGNCEPEAAITVDKFTAKPMKPRAGEDANVFVSISNSGDGGGTVDVTLDVVCNNGDSASQVFHDQYIGPNETRSDFTVQWKPSSMTDCTVTARALYSVASCGDLQAASGSFQMWVDAAPEPPTCVCEPDHCTPCPEQPTCEDLPNFCRDQCGEYNLVKNTKARRRAVHKCEREVGLPRNLCYWRIKRCYVECVK